MILEDASGNAVEAIPFCCGNCHRDYAGDAYAGWNGCVETEFTTYCANCGVVIPGADACTCQRDNVIVNRFLSDTGEHCEHGNWIQVPSDHL